MLLVQMLPILQSENFCRLFHIKNCSATRVLSLPRETFCETSVGRVAAKIQYRTENIINRYIRYNTNADYLNYPSFFAQHL